MPWHSVMTHICKCGRAACVRHCDDTWTCLHCAYRRWRRDHGRELARRHTNRHDLTGETCTVGISYYPKDLT
jgi:hypothetical protein